jgi:hypothetical protein
MSEISHIPNNERTNQTETALSLARSIIDARRELASMPADALIEVATQGIVTYHREGAAYGFESDEVVALRQEKDVWMSLLSDDSAREQAIHYANVRLDDLET